MKSVKVLLSAFAICLLMANVSVAYNANSPQPFAGMSTIAAPELLDGPEVSTKKTIQDGNVSTITQKLIEQGVIPQIVDQRVND